MQPIRYASPLYIVREDCEKDLLSVLSRIKALGFDGVELLGFFGLGAAEIAAHLRKIGLICLGNHVPYDQFVQDIGQVIADHRALKSKYVTLGTLPDFAKTDLLEGWARTMREEGMTLLYHNHAKELMPDAAGEMPLDAILRAAPSMMLEPDLGWMRIAGADPLAHLLRYPARCPVIHFKDYMPADGPEPYAFRPVGYGIVNYPRLMDATLACAPEWLVADHDCAYERDSYDELALSLHYMKNLVSLFSTRQGGGLCTNPGCI